MNELIKKLTEIAEKEKITVEEHIVALELIHEINTEIDEKEIYIEEPEDALLPEDEGDVSIDPWIGLTVEGIVDNFNITENKAKAKSLGINNYSKLKEVEVAQLVFDKINS